MRDFFDHPVCECLSLELVGLAITTPDASMEVTELFLSCTDCDATFYEAADPDLHALADAAVALKPAAKRTRRPG